MRTKVEVKAVSTKNGSVLIKRPDGAEEWLYVADNVKPFLKNLKKGEAEMEEEGDAPIPFIRNTGGFSKTTFKPKSQGNVNIEESARLRRKTDCLRMAVDMAIAKLIDKTEIMDKAKGLTEYVEKEEPEIKSAGEQ